MSYEPLFFFSKEDELERSNERCKNGENKIIDLEEELKVI